MIFFLYKNNLKQLYFQNKEFSLNSSFQKENQKSDELTPLFYAVSEYSSFF